MISPIISMRDFKKKEKTEDMHTTKTDDCILKTDNNRNRNEVGRGRRHEHRDSGNLYERSFRHNVHDARGDERSELRQADTSITTALTTETPGGSTVSTPLRVSLGEPSLPNVCTIIIIIIIII